jgi:hypothetical protein
MERLLAEMQAMQGKLDMMKAKMDVHHEEMMAIMKADREEMEACLEKREPTPEEMEAVAERQEFSNGATYEEKIGATEDRSDDASGRRLPQTSEETYQHTDGSQQKFSTAHRAVFAPSKSHCHEEPGGTFRNRIKDRGMKQWLCLENEKTLKERTL